MDNVEKKFELPFWGWVLMMLLMAIGYSDFITIARLLSGLEKFRYAELLHLIPALQVVGLLFVYKGKRIGIYLLGMSYTLSIAFEFLASGQLPYLKAVLSYAVIIIFRLAIFKGEESSKA